MKKVLLIFAILLVSGFASKSLIDEISPLWQIWKDRYQKTYTEEEELERFSIFATNYEKIMKFNAESDSADSAKLALNKFADLTNAEFAAKNSRCAYVETDEEFIRENTLPLQNISSLPDSIDWRNKSAVTPVKDQGNCGSCWAFSATGVIEGFYFIKEGKLLSFSEQQIVDCDTTEDEGCNGGWHYLAVEYAAKNGLEVESDYPYTARDGGCRYDQSKAITVCSGYKFVKPNSRVDLMAALVNGPVSVAIEADQTVFQFYSRGVISAGCGADVDHAVLVVGYQKVGILEAFIVKNSWGTSWGDKGYVYISTIQQLNRDQGACGILYQPVVPV